MRIHYLRLDKHKIIDAWKNAEELDTTNLRKILNANLRDLFDDEVILDCETKFFSKVVENRLKKEGRAFEVWDTGSRGNHIVMRLQGLKNLNEKLRILYREEEIKKYGTDNAKKTGFIAMEWRPHLKTGKIKHLLYKNNGSDSIDMRLLYQAKLKYEELNKPKTYVTYDKTESEELKKKIKVSELWMKWGMQKNGSNWDTPFGISVGKKCVSINDNKGVFYDFHNSFGGDIFSAVEVKYNCGFLEALERLKEGDY